MRRLRPTRRIPSAQRRHHRPAQLHPPVAARCLPATIPRQLRPAVYHQMVAVRKLHRRQLRLELHRSVRSVPLPSPSRHVNALTRYDTKQFACRYARLPDGYALSSLSWGTGTCFFVASVRHTAQDPAGHRSGVLIYRFNHWHPAWHLDKLQPPHFLLHTGLCMPNYTRACTIRAAAAKRGAGGNEMSRTEREEVDEAEGAGDVEWKDRYMICPENYPLSAGMLQPASSPGQQSPLIVVQAEVEPSGCRVFVVFAAADHPPNVPRPTHVAAYAPRFTSL
jgi:hypothetical protein